MIENGTVSRFRHISSAKRAARSRMSSVSFLEAGPVSRSRSGILFFFVSVHFGESVESMGWLDGFVSVSRRRLPLLLCCRIPVTMGVSPTISIHQPGAVDACGRDPNGSNTVPGFGRNCGGSSWRSLGQALLCRGTAEQTRSTGGDARHFVSVDDCGSG